MSSGRYGRVDEKSFRLQPPEICATSSIRLQSKDIELGDRHGYGVITTVALQKSNSKNCAKKIDEWCSESVELWNIAGEDEVRTMLFAISW